MHHSGKMGGEVDKKVTKSDIGGRVAAKKSDANHSNKCE